MSKLIIPKDEDVSKFVALKFYKNKLIYILFNLCFCDIIAASQVKRVINGSGSRVRNEKQITYYYTTCSWLKIDKLARSSIFKMMYHKKTNSKNKNKYRVAHEMSYHW
jgi:hypothetical protein